VQPDGSPMCQSPDVCSGDPVIRTEDLGDCNYLCDHHHAEALRFNDYEFEVLP
jgi:hypothetical protein